MLAHFADPFPEEILYSALARLGDRLQYPSKTTLVQKLFQVKTRSSIIDLPTSHDQLIRNLPVGHSYTADDLIDKYTLLPFFAAFLPNERIEEIREDMHTSGGVRSKAALLKSSIPPLQWLRFCPACFEEDRQRFGEGFWHRIHQISGIEVCPHHQLFLENSTAKARNRSHPSEFISAEQVIIAIKPRPIDINQPTHAFLFDLSVQAFWLLNHENRQFLMNDLRGRYQVLLIRNGYRNYRGFLHINELLRAFKNYYPIELLEVLHCELDGHIGNWLLRVVHLTKAQHPILHILFMNFFGYKVEEFFNLPTTYNPFGEGPWPCLNSTCDYYQQALISNYTLKFNPKSKLPVGIFGCECGFIYSRTGSKNHEPYTTKISKIFSFGHVWEAKLQELWSDNNYSINQIAQQLNVTTSTVRKHALKLNLSFPRFRGRNKGTLSKSIRSKWLPSTSLIENKRCEWLTALKENSGCGLSVVRHKTQRLYTWLLTHDGDWLGRHMPKEVVETVEKQAIVNWAERDAQLAAKVREAGQYLRNIPGPPQRIKRDTIGRYVDKLTTIRKEKHRLPLTAKALAEEVETPLMFALRRLNWAAELFIHDNIKPTRKQLIRQANIWNYVNLPEVVEAIDKILHRLHD